MTCDPARGGQTGCLRKGDHHEGTAGAGHVARDDGVGIAPEDLPEVIERFFDQAAQIGSHVTLICDWHSMPRIVRIRQICNLARSHGLKVHLYLDPVALQGGRKEPSIPETAAGNSFLDPSVGKAYQATALSLAALGPDYLGLATEVNLFTQNRVEYDALRKLIGAAYREVKARRPDLPVTVSFQWDVMTYTSAFESVSQFKGIVDVYSFTSYPDEFGNANPKVPDNYFLRIRRLLPNARIGISELGWSSAAPGSEKEQAEFLLRLPALTKDLGAEYVTLAELHDVPIFTGDQSRLNAIGLRSVDDVPKNAWEAILTLPAIE